MGAAQSSSPKSTPDRESPCEQEFAAFLKCVEMHPQGLKARDCEDIRDMYKACMKGEPKK